MKTLQDLIPRLKDNLYYSRNMIDLHMGEIITSISEFEAWLRAAPSLWQILEILNGERAISILDSIVLPDPFQGFNHALNILLHTALREYKDAKLPRVKYPAPENLQLWQDLEAVILKLAAVPNLHLLWLLDEESIISPLGYLLYWDLVETDFLSKFLSIAPVRETINNNCRVASKSAYYFIICLPALAIAVFNQADDQILQLLVAAGADVNAICIDHRRHLVPLIGAASETHTDLTGVQFLIEYGADLNAVYVRNVRNAQHQLVDVTRTPLRNLFIQVERKNPFVFELEQLMLEKGASLAPVDLHFTGRLIQQAPDMRILAKDPKKGTFAEFSSAYIVALFLPYAFAMLQQVRLIDAVNSKILAAKPKRKQMPASVSGTILQFSGHMPTGAKPSDAGEYQNEIVKMIRKVFIFAENDVDLRNIVMEIYQQARTRKVFEKIFAQFLSHLQFSELHINTRNEIIHGCAHALYEFLHTRDLLRADLEPKHIFADNCSVVLHKFMLSKIRGLSRWGDWGFWYTSTNKLWVADSASGPVVKVFAEALEKLPLGAKTQITATAAKHHYKPPEA